MLSDHNGEGARHARAHGHGPRLARSLRVLVLGTMTGLWLSGAAWLGLHYLLAAPGEFGPVPHPLEAPVVRLHGIVGLGFLVLIGWIMPAHALRHLGTRQARPSGVALLVVAALLSISGFALFYVVDGGLRQGLAIPHEIVGLAALALVLPHVLGRSRGREADRTAAAGLGEHRSGGPGRRRASGRGRALILTLVAVLTVGAAGWLSWAHA